VAETARLAHKLGFKSNATMLYGHIENDEDRVDHLLKLRALQDETGGFQTFIPLAFHPENTALDHLPVTTGLTDIRQVAVSRLLLDNFPHIKAYWQMLTRRLRRLRCALAPTTWTARWWRRRFTTTPARPRRRA
jgi:aminodeoxyfutalosine synthase